MSIINNSSEIIKLRSINKGDLEGLTILFRNENVYPFIIDNGPLDDHEIAKKAEIMEISEDPKYWAIEHIVMNKFVGYIGLFNTNRSDPVISYAILPKYQRNGFCELALLKLFNELKIKYTKITARTHIKNSSSQQLLQKLGFNLVGEIKWKSEKRLEYVLDLLYLEN
jgi:RimJ/RimL family protein N-acetyltransferase